MVRGGWNDADLYRLREQVEEARDLEAAMRHQVRWLRQEGCPWSVIAESLGVTKQSAWRKYGDQ